MVLKCPELERGDLNIRGLKPMEICQACVAVLRGVQCWLTVFCPPGLHTSHVTENYELVESFILQRKWWNSKK